MTPCPTHHKPAIAQTRVLSYPGLAHRLLRGKRGRYIFCYRLRGMKITTCVKIMPVLVMFEFSSDDPGFRKRLLDAILDDHCPDFECSLGSPGLTGKSYTALWRAERAKAVCLWAESIGSEMFKSPSTVNPHLPPMAHIPLPDIGDIAPGGVVGPCISDAERLLADQCLESTAHNWIAVCDHFLSLPLICSERAAAFRLLRQAIERAALAAVKINPQPISQGAAG